MSETPAAETESLLLTPQSGQGDLGTTSSAGSSSRSSGGCTDRQKLKIAMYILSNICAIGYIVCAFVGFTGKELLQQINVNAVVLLYCLASGVFFIVVTLPIPRWKHAMETIFPFIFSFAGRAAFHFLVGPLLVISRVVGVVFAVISIVLAAVYIIIYIVLRKSTTIGSFFRPFDPDVEKKKPNWDLEYGGGSGSSNLYQQSAAGAPSASRASQSRAPSSSSSTTAYNPFGSSGIGGGAGAGVGHATASMASGIGIGQPPRASGNRVASPGTTGSSSSPQTSAQVGSPAPTPSEKTQFSTTNPFAPPPATSSGLEEIEKNPFGEESEEEKARESQPPPPAVQQQQDANSIPATNTSLSTKSNNPFDF